MSFEPQLLRPHWPDRPVGVEAAVTLRDGGCSRPPWASLNLGAHVGDDPECVARNRRAVASALSLPAEPVWLQQVHGTAVARIEAASTRPDGEADAAYTTLAGVPLCILTADCLPILITDRDGQEIGVAHAGWRSLCHGVVENLLQHFRMPASALTAWLGPAIGPEAFEVGPEVREAFIAAQSEAARAFRSGTGDRWLADINALARLRLQRAGVGRISGGGDCTFSDSGRYFSYRREGQTGRMATLIWRTDAAAADTLPQRR